MSAPPELLAAVPDVPRWIEARAVLLQNCGSWAGDERGWVIRNEQTGARLVALVGRPGPEHIEAALADRPSAEILCAADDADANAVSLPGFTRERARLLELDDESRLGGGDDRVRLLTDADALDHLPADLREEMVRAVKTYEVHAAFTDDRARSFAYAYWQTETRFDVSVDTLAEFRRQGLARATASALIRAQLGNGKRPVWGAMESNLSSQVLAAKLGFVPVDEIAVFTRGG